MGIFGSVLVFIYLEIIRPFLLAAYFNHSYVCVWTYGSIHTNIFCLFMSKLTEPLVIIPMETTGLTVLFACVICNTPTKLHVVFPLCTYNAQGPEHTGKLGTTTTEIHIYSNNTVFYSDVQIRINDKESCSQGLAHHSSQPDLLCQDDLKV